MKTVWVNGCFDVLHRGHFELFRYAKSLGEKLFVGIDSDTKIQNDKGPTRPFNSENDRKFALECIRYIDKVVIFDSRNGLIESIRNLSPDIIVVGSDWRGKEVVGSEFCSDLQFFDRIPGYSTTNILGENQ